MGGRENRAEGNGGRSGGRGRGRERERKRERERERQSHAYLWQRASRVKSAFETSMLLTLVCQKNIIRMTPIAIIAIM